MEAASFRGRSIAWVVCAAVAGCGAPRLGPVTTSTPSGLHFDVSAVDTHVDPCSDFYQYACGGWLATHPIPADRVRYSRYTEMEELNLEHERAVVEDAARVGRSGTRAEQRVGAYFTACMDEARIEARGLEPLRDSFARIDAIRSTADAVALVTDLHVHGVDALFAIGTRADAADAKRQRLVMGRGVLGLPDAGDYGRTEPVAAALRTAYVEHLRRVFALLGEPPQDAERDADAVIALETSLSMHALSPAARRQIGKQQHLVSLAELQSRYGTMDWASYFRAMGAPGAVDAVNVREPTWLEAVDAALRSTDRVPIRAYLKAVSVKIVAASSVTPMPRRGSPFCGLREVD